MGIGKKAAALSTTQPASTPPPSTPVMDLPGVEFPEIGTDDKFVAVVKKLSRFFVDQIQIPSTIDQLRTTAAGNTIRYLVDYLVSECTNPLLINSLLTLKFHFSALDDDRGINETRANACEIVAWRFLTRISERDAVDYCLYELNEEDGVRDRDVEDATETSSLLPQFRARDPSASVRPSSKRSSLLKSVSNVGGIFTIDDDQEDEEEDPTSLFIGLNGLEIAAIADCKRFLSQRIVQKIIHGIWIGDICFWSSLEENTQKKAQFYNKRRPDPFTRLRVPRYIKAFEILFFALGLLLYYGTLLHERSPTHITPIETAFYIWLASFAYDELSEFLDAGIFYSVDIWNSCDLAIIVIGLGFFSTRLAGLLKDSDEITNVAFDILALAALFIVPRICSLLSLHPYFGTLIPCLKAMTKDFVKFMVVVVILYLGFLTSFSVLGRANFKVSEMSWILVKVFFGSSYLGFDIMNDINQHLGPPLMLLFVCMTNILLVTSLISILSNSFSNVIAHAREEYLYVSSVYVLEASTSNRLTHFYPPFNLIPLVFIRPLRLFIPAERLRSARILLLKATHFPIVGAIWLFERAYDHLIGGAMSFSSIGPGSQPDLGNKKRKSIPFLTNSNRASSNYNSKDFTETRSDNHDPHTPMRSERGERAEVIVDNTNLEKMVEDLSIKLAELTALVMAQQGSAPDESL